MALTSTVVRAGGFMVSEANNFRSRDKAVMLSGQDLDAGHVLGKTLVGATATATAAAGNTGNGTMGAITVTAAARNGTYQLVITEPGADVGEFDVQDPRGALIGQGTVASAFSAGGLAFTLADGATDFAAGDRFDILVVGGTEKFKEYNPANTDGSQVPVAISWDRYDATAADVVGAVVARDCEVNIEELVWFSGATSGQKTAALKYMADNFGIIGRPAV